MSKILKVIVFTVVDILEPLIKKVRREEGWPRERKEKLMEIWQNFLHVDDLDGKLRLANIEVVYCLDKAFKIIFVLIIEHQISFKLYSILQQRASSYH